MLLLTKQMAKREGVTEQLKVQDQKLWVQRMNNIRDRAAVSIPRCFHITAEKGIFLCSVSSGITKNA